MVGGGGGRKSGEERWSVLGFPKDLHKHQRKNKKIKAASNGKLIVCKCPNKHYMEDLMLSGSVYLPSSSYWLLSWRPYSLVSKISIRRRMRTTSSSSSICGKRENISSSLQKTLLMGLHVEVLFGTQSSSFQPVGHEVHHRQTSKISMHSR